MINMNERIIRLTAEDLNWNFDASSRPVYRERNRFSWQSSIAVDPFPCYAHNIELVAELVAQVEQAFPLGCLPMWYILSHEGEGRTNGWCSINTIHDEDKQREAKSHFEPVIVLQGKRIPIHPAMTRYLVAHEYGHAVEAWIRRRMSARDTSDERNRFLEEYARRRGIKYEGGYGGMQWHKNTGEVFANDFRIVVAGAEKEFWPHDVPRPGEAVAKLWADWLLPWVYVAEQKPEAIVANAA